MFDFSEYFIGFVKDTIVNERPIFGDYIDEYEHHIDSAVEEFYNDYADEMNDEYRERPDEVAELREEYAQLLIDDYLDTYTLTDSLRENCDLSLTYTSDIFDFYRENMEDCDNALSELGGADQYGSISEALYSAVTYAREQYAVNELEEYLDSIHNALIYP